MLIRLIIFGECRVGADQGKGQFFLEMQKWWTVNSTCRLTVHI